MPSVLVVDDDATIRETLVEFFEQLGHVARGAATATEGRRVAAAHSPDVALVDLRLPDADGLRLLEVLRADHPDLAVILLTGHGDVATAVRAMREGAADFLEKPIDLEALDAAVRRAAEHARLARELAVLRAKEAGALWTETASVSPLPDLDRLVELAARNDDAPVLVIGETGTGKGYVARQIHERSPRREQPYVEINCASLSAQFVESELFGHEKGAFTDAKQAKRGLLEVAGRGTMFLDEVAELSPEVQPKLLKAIEERAFRRLGGTATLTSDARLIVATHVPLADAVARGSFRADLYYRLQVLTIALPPLRARRGEIPRLAEALLPRGARLAESSRAALEAYDWPGNIRELKNALWRASILADGAPIRPEHLGLTPAGAAATPVSTEVTTLAEAERRAISAALASTGGNKARAADVLGIARSTLLEKLRRLALAG
ncbi:sigma-54 dependent transcriptional regulator [Roseisolibacter sp. H3M3-2]|uniref:sigma-54-dependent transcriptional regulator n=1 Tax=Roseisolibacter sp. H3M3-2 TaxID=3031323 RepID=UPI0023DA5120|nr:sigma-54 dependent transcriptional regulator [Roseisolibacter sp. H3M3-2]MDF1503639.1 sigma-54 dependent transcriptional regulator [Roseisolibacter sp. H3M3-2]